MSFEYIDYPFVLDLQATANILELTKYCKMNTCFNVLDLWGTHLSIYYAKLLLIAINFNKILMSLLVTGFIICESIVTNSCVYFII